MARAVATAEEAMELCLVGDSPPSSPSEGDCLLRRSGVRFAPAAPRRWQRRAATGVLVAGTAVAVWSFAPPASSRADGRGAAAGLTAADWDLPDVVNATIGLSSADCQDTPGWTNGWAGCAYSKVGKDPTLCALKPGASWPETAGFTCKYYEVKGLCANGQYKSFAMGPGLGSPETNCCACKGFVPALECNRDTEGSCRWTNYCNPWRGPTECESGKCVCEEGYCTDSVGTCAHDARADNFERKVAKAQGVKATEEECSRETNGKCFMGLGCQPWRGAITCSGTQCVCQPGYCADHLGLCFKDRGVVKANVVPINARQTKFPGPQIVTALTASGGGSRALSAALGAYRALRDLGLLTNIDLISSVSGGSWASSILMFADMDLNTLLGPPTDPSKLTLAVLDKTPPPLGAVAMAKTTDIALKLKLQGVPFGLLWVATVAQAFLEPFKLNRFDAFMAPDAQTVENIKARNPQFADATFYTPKPGRAKNIVMGSTVLSPNGYKANADNVVYFQAGPDYSGSAFYPQKDAVDYVNNDISGAPLTHVLLGGGLVETFAFGSSTPATRRGQFGGEDIEMHAPARPFSLARAVGMSSAAFGGQMANMPGMGGYMNPQADMWPVSSLEHPRPQQSLRYMIGDGGNLENTGLLATLQRGATRIVSLVNGDKLLTAGIDFCSSPGYIPTGTEITNQFANLFGYAKTTDAATMEFHENNQVFDSSEYLPILCEFSRLEAAGKPLTVYKQLQVQRNDWWGINGGFNIEIVFAVLSKSKQFESLLPQETRAALEEGPAGGLSGFPGFKTTFMNGPDLTQYTARQINLLSALTEWAVHQNADLFRRVLGG